MAREQTDREDLLREATALVERIEMIPVHFEGLVASGDSIVMGFRAHGALSIFFGPDPVYQFNASGELRRAYVDGLLYKSQHGRLIELKRVRAASEVQLLRRELTDAQSSAFLRRLHEKLNLLASTLEADAFSVVGQVPPAAPLLPRLRRWLADHRRPLLAADARA